MRNQYLHLTLITVCLAVTLAAPGQVRAWVGLELDGKATGVADPYGATGTEGSGSLGEFSARVMYQDNLGPLEAEVHWLGQFAHTTGDTSFSTGPLPSPFRILDLETVHSQDDRTVLFSEIDRLLLTFTAPGFSLHVGRQAVTWGEAFYFNIGDLFGAFPVTETNRRYKPGIDAATLTVNPGPFSSLSLAVVPVEDERDNLAATALFPLGPGTLSLTGGRILDDEKAGTGYTVDISGTQVYGSWLFTKKPDSRHYWQTVAGAQRQIGPYTLIMGELFRNGWGSGDPDDYPSLLFTEEYAAGNIFTLGRYSAALQVSRQVSPLVTMTPALFGNLTDGSALLRVDGALSLSDLTDISGGFFLGMGKRPDEGIPMSEYGQIPFSIYVEIVHNI